MTKNLPPLPDTRPVRLARFLTSLDTSRQQTLRLALMGAPLGFYLLTGLGGLALVAWVSCWSLAAALPHLVHRAEAFLREQAQATTRGLSVDEVFPELALWVKGDHVRFKSRADSPGKTRQGLAPSMRRTGTRSVQQAVDEEDALVYNYESIEVDGTLYLRRGGRLHRLDLHDLDAEAVINEDLEKRLAVREQQRLERDVATGGYADFLRWKREEMEQLGFADLVENADSAGQSTPYETEHTFKKIAGRD